METRVISKYKNVSAAAATAHDATSIKLKANWKMMTMRLAGEVKVYKDEGNDTKDKMEGNLGRV